MSSINTKFAVLFLLLAEVLTIQLQQGEQFKGNNVYDNQLNQCLNIQRDSGVGTCFGKEFLAVLNNYDESETFSLANGISFVRDEKTPRDIGSFLDKDPMDFRSILEDASNLISKRSLHWDLSAVYPGLVMRIAPTLANGMLEFVMDPRIKDRAYHHQQQGELSTGRLLARNLLVPFLLGFKFQLSTLLPLLLGFLLLASKKAFILAKLALVAVTLFSGSGFGQGFGGYSGPSLSSYTSSYEHPGHFNNPHSSSGYYNRQPHYSEYYYREKSAETTAAPITPGEIRDRLERFFITKKDSDQEAKMSNSKNYIWTPIDT